MAYGSRDFCVGPAGLLGPGLQVALPNKADSKVSGLVQPGRDQIVWRDLLTRLPYSCQVHHGNPGIKIVSKVGLIESDWLGYPVRLNTMA